MSDRNPDFRMRSPSGQRPQGRTGTQGTMASPANPVDWKRTNPAPLELLENFVVVSVFDTLVEVRERFRIALDSDLIQTHFLDKLRDRKPMPDN
jgi:hypothetical protein